MRKLENNQKIIWTISLFFIYIVMIIGFAPEVLAQGSFTYKVLKPENQQSQVGYFDLRLQAGQEQTVKIELSNPSEKVPVTVGVKLNSTKTNSNGVLEYGPAAIKKDASLKYDFEKIVTAPKEVALKPKETKTLDLTIQMPKEQYDGVVSGGIELMARLTKEELKKREEASGISNEYAFLIAMLLTETDKKVDPDISFNTMKAGLSNYRNAVFVNFSNTQMTYLEEMNIDFQVMKKGQKEVLYDTRKTDMTMAPNSMIDFPVMMGGDEMVPGQYTGHVVVTSHDKKWEWTQDFTITKEEASKYNKQDVSLVQERGINWWLIVAIAVGIIILVVVVYLIVRKVNRKKQTERLRKKKQK